MRLAERLLGLTLVGANWVFWLLIGLSVLSVAVMVERAIRLGGRPVDLESFGKELLERLSRGDIIGARKLVAAKRTPEADVVSSGIDQFERGAAAVSAAMAGAKSKLRIDLERNLGVLGTLGNNAPFIGLFGTVLGIIRSFADLSHNQGGGMGIVIGGIAEALVATALGLLVAIPAVVAFNYFQGKIRRILGRVDIAAQMVLVSLPVGPVATAAGSVAAENRKA